MFHVEHYERGWSEVLKITEAPALIHAGLYHLELDGRQVGTVNVFSGCLDAIREALEETPEAAYLLEEQGREIATLVRRVERAEAVKESLTSALRDIKKNVDDWNLQDYVTIRRLVKSALRTAEESSVVDSAPAKQPEAMINLDKAFENKEEVKRILVENSCPSDFGFEKHCSIEPDCETCWSREVEE